MVSRFRSLSFAAISIFLSLLASFLFLEILLRWFPVNEGLGALPVNQDNPVLRYTPNRSSIWSKGWNFSIVNHVRTNNYGFVTDIDYDPKATTPLLAIIGDSYVEAAMVPYTQTAAAILAKSVGQKGRVYTFGASGSTLSQYLAYAQYARDTFHPACLTIVIVSNDFDESFWKYRNEPGYHYFEERSDGELGVTRIDREVNPLRRMLGASSLVKYVVVNLEAPRVWEHLKEFSQSHSITNQPYVGNVLANVDRTRVFDSQRAVDAFLRLLPSMAGLEPSKILLGIDGNRREIYDNHLESAKGSYFDVMRRYLMLSAKAKGYETIDMQQEFIDHYERHGQRFEFPTDGHWNGVAHAVLARAIQHSSVYRGCFTTNSLSHAD
jgi:hypothetical protein